jgi:hypothetical protein
VGMTLEPGEWIVYLTIVVGVVLTAGYTHITLSRWGD